MPSILALLCRIDIAQHWGMRVLARITTLMVPTTPLILAGSSQLPPSAAMRDSSSDRLNASHFFRRRARCSTVCVFCIDGRVLYQNVPLFSLQLAGGAEVCGKSATRNARLSQPVGSSQAPAKPGRNRCLGSLLRVCWEQFFDQWLQPSAVRVGCVRVPGLEGGFDARRLHIGELEVLCWDR